MSSRSSTMHSIWSAKPITAVNVEMMVNQRTGWIFYGLVIIFWLGQLWCSPYASFDSNLELGNNPFYDHHLNFFMRYIDRFLDDPSLIGNRFSRYEVCLGALALYILVAFRGFRRVEKFPAFFFCVSLLAVLLSFLNPNNSFPDVKYLLTFQPRILYLYLLFLLAFTFLRADVLAVILKKFFVIGAGAAIALAGYSLFFFLIGKGPMHLGHMSTLPNSEHLDLLAIFSGIFLVLYFQTRKKCYLACVILFHLVIFFGDRRAQTAVLLASDVMIAVYYLKENMFRKLKRFLVPGILLSALILISVSVSKFDYSYNYQRFLSVFAPESYNSKYYDDSGHWNQTVTTFKTMFDNLDKIERFWGAGMRNEMNYIEGQTAYIHNSFVAVWAIYGLHMSFFYFFLFIVFFVKSISLYLKNITPSNMIVAAVTFTYLMIIIGTAFTGEFIFKHFIYASFLPLILSVFNLREINQSVLLPSPKYKLRI